MALDDDGEPEKEPEYPPRPHGSFGDLNDILKLAIHNQLTTSYTGKLTAIDEALAPASGASAFAAARKEAGKSGRRGYSAGAREARKSAKIAKKAAAKANEVAGVETEDLSEMSAEERRAAKKRKAEEGSRNESLKSKLARCGTSEF